MSSIQSLGVVLRVLASSCGTLSAFPSFADVIPGFLPWAIVSHRFAVFSGVEEGNFAQADL